MQFAIEKKISNFIESQFPQFYLDEGPNFVLFVKAYYEWMESEGQAINQSRSLFDLRDIDNTMDSFLSHFQQKYLYGIPFKTIANPKFLLKHILDVYRSKGSIDCYKLLFKLIYNQDVEIYLPGQDLLKPSDGTWIQPQYLEVTQTNNLASFVGQTVRGFTSNTTAVVEDYISQPINQNIISTLYISNMQPKGGSFLTGEKVVIQSQVGNTAAVTASPSIVGSLDSLSIYNGGQGFNIGDIIAIAHLDANNNVISDGIDGKLRVTSVSRGQGSLNFNIAKGGFGYTSNTNVFLYNGAGDSTGAGASFSLGNLSYVQNLPYNTDLIVDFYNTQIDAAAYGFPANNSANAISSIQGTLTFKNNNFGTIAALTNIQTGNGYTQAPSIFVRSTQLATNNLPGTVSYSTTSNTITGSGTTFTYFYSNGDVIYLQADSSNTATSELQVIKTVVNDTTITLYGPPKQNSTGTAISKNAPVVLPSNYAYYDPQVLTSDGSIDGINELITGNPSTGNNIVATTTAINSGRGYIEGETVVSYLLNGLSPIVITNPGIGYTNNDVVHFYGGSTSPATGYVTTDGTGAIVSVPITGGSNYTSLPTIVIKTRTGSNAVLTTSILPFNTTSQVTGRVNKTGVGRQIGYWSTTRGFLNSDKYIQDSYFYQDFSYQIKAAATLDKYKDILYTTFHTSGAELFGEFLQINNEASFANLLSETTSANIDNYLYFKVDSTLITSDSTYLITSNSATTDTNYLYSDNIIKLDAFI